MDLNLAIEYRALDALTVDPGNPRKHSARQIKKLARGIRKHGFLNPIIIDQNGRIVAGEARYLAAKRLNLSHVPVIRIEHLSEAELRRYRLADNRLPEDASWDPELLKVELEYLVNLDVSFDLELTGFDAPEIDAFLTIPPNVAEEPPPEAPPPDEAVTRPGDIWCLGQHRVACGDARDSQLVSDVMAGQLAQMVLTDPPYNVPIAGHVCGNGAVHHQEFAMASGEMSEAEFEAFLSGVLLILLAVSENTALHYVFMDWRHVRTLLSIGEGLYYNLLNLCVWTKTNGGMGSLYRSQHELIAVFKVGAAPHINNVQLGRYGRNRTNVWTYPGVNSFGAGRNEALAMHPTVKPVALLADAILDVTHRDNIVLDPFLGSGSTLMAAERTHRVCYGLELEPRYVDVALRRWMVETGETPYLAGSEATFPEVAASRLSVVSGEG